MVKEGKKERKKAAIPMTVCLMLEESSDGLSQIFTLVWLSSLGTWTHDKS
jgi:hypothetical protein